VIKKTNKQKEAIKFLTEHDESLLFGSARSGKTFIIIYAILIRAIKEPNTNHMIVRKYSNSLRRSIWSQTLPDVMRLAFSELYKQCKINETLMTLTLPNNSKLMFVGCDNRASMDKILGTECSTLYCDELPELLPEQFGLLKSRLAEKSHLKTKLFTSCNPTGKNSWIYKYFVENNLALQMNVADNLENVSDTFVKQLKRLSEKQKTRFLYGEWLAEQEGALWSIDLIANTRKEIGSIEMDRIVIGVDPAVTSKQTSDLTGIIVCGKKDEDFYVLEDCSDKYTPEQLASKIEVLWSKYEADAIVIETNNGGDYLLDNITKQNEYINVIGVNHRKSKIVRAESVSFLYEKNLCHHTSVFEELEDELVSYTIESKWSPDRLDALVIALRELLGTKQCDMSFGHEFKESESERSERMWQRL